MASFVGTGAAAVAFHQDFPRNTSIEFSWTRSVQEFAPLHIYAINARGNATLVIPSYFQLELGLGSEPSSEVAVGTPVKDVVVSYPLPPVPFPIRANLTAPPIADGWFVWAWANLTVPGSITIHWPDGARHGDVLAGQSTSADVAGLDGGAHVVTPALAAAAADGVQAHAGRGFILDVYALRSWAEVGNWSATWEGGSAGGDLAGPRPTTSCVSCYDQHGWLVVGNGTPTFTANYVAFSQQARVYVTIVTLPVGLPSLRMDWCDPVGDVVCGA